MRSVRSVMWVDGSRLAIGRFIAQGAEVLNMVIAQTVGTCGFA